MIFRKSLRPLITVSVRADAMNKRDIATTLISNVTVMPEEALDMQVVYSTDKRLSLTFADSADETEQIDRVNQGKYTNKSAYLCINELSIYVIAIRFL